MPDGSALNAALVLAVALTTPVLECVQRFDPV